MEPKSIGTRSICQSVNEQLSGRVFKKNIYMYDTPTFYVLFTKIEERHLTYKWQLPRRNLAILSEKSHHQVIPNGGIQVL